MALGPRDLSDTMRALARTAPRPVIVDVYNVGGSIATARRFADNLAHAGVAALYLEDSAYPRTNSFALHRSCRRGRRAAHRPHPGAELRCGPAQGA
ncbi:hypothetical protein ACFVYE_36420 [Streptomyces sp. NPDC058239]|uniref:hypothetical protein n=1 Tax=unclassified Streptomyces TaxID=2593676 RepID=UPI00365BA892